MGLPAHPVIPPMLNKVPEVSLVFRIIKVMATTIGESGADFLAVQVGLVTAMTTGIMVVFLIVAIAELYGARLDLENANQGGVPA